MSFSDGLGCRIRLSGHLGRPDLAPLELGCHVGWQGAIIGLREDADVIPLLLGSPIQPLSCLKLLWLDPINCLYDVHGPLFLEPGEPATPREGAWAA